MPEDLPADTVTALRHELADVEAALEEPVDERHQAQLRAARENLEARIAAQQNPVASPALEHEVDAVSGQVVGSDPEDYRPAPQDLVIAPGAERHEVLQVLDAHDEDMILQEVQRRALRTMLYDFPQGGSKIIDLSYQGVNECVRVMNASGKTRIRVAPQSLRVDVEAEDGIAYYVATVYAEDELTGYGQFGTAREPKLLKLKDKASADREKKKGNVVHERDGSFYTFDPFARTKAVNKAQRNALKVQIPERIRQALIAMAKNDASMLQTIAHGAGAEAAATLPAPADSDEAKALTKQIRDVYTEIRQRPGGIAGPYSLLPGRFNLELSRAAHDEAQLEALLASLRARLATIDEQS